MYFTVIVIHSITIKRRSRHFHAQGIKRCASRGHPAKTGARKASKSAHNMLPKFAVSVFGLRKPDSAVTRAKKPFATAESHELAAKTDTANSGNISARKRRLISNAPLDQRRQLWAWPSAAKQPTSGPQHLKLVCGISFEASPAKNALLVSVLRGAQPKIGSFWLKKASFGAQIHVTGIKSDTNNEVLNSAPSKLIPQTKNYALNTGTSTISMVSKTLSTARS